VGGGGEHGDAVDDAVELATEDEYAREIEEQGLRGCLVGGDGIGGDEEKQGGVVQCGKPLAGAEERLDIIIRDGGLDPGLGAAEGEGAVAKLFLELGALVVDAVFLDERGDEAEAVWMGVSVHITTTNTIQQLLTERWRRRCEGR
jgi:hypothetical protein